MESVWNPDRDCAWNIWLNGTLSYPISAWIAIDSTCIVFPRWWQMYPRFELPQISLPVHPLVQSFALAWFYAYRSPGNFCVVKFTRNSNTNIRQCIRERVIFDNTHCPKTQKCKQICCNDRPCKKCPMKEIHMCYTSEWVRLVQISRSCTLLSLLRTVICHLHNFIES